MRAAALLLLVAACGRLGFEGVGRVEDDAGMADADGSIDGPTAVALAQSGSLAGGYLERTLATAPSRTTFTFSSWYKSTGRGAMIFNCAAAGDMQSFIWAGTTTGRPDIEHQVGMVFTDYSPAQTWPYSGVWMHLVVAVDTTQADPTKRVRMYYDGFEQTLGSTTPIAQNTQLFLGSQNTHALGAKADGNFGLQARFADTYIIWGHQLDPSSFVRPIAGQLRSIEYRGPITPESVHFDYAQLGANSFSTEPNWTVTGTVTRDSDDTPY